LMPVIDELFIWADGAGAAACMEEDFQAFCHLFWIG
jgi:hypothetical protein